MYRQARLSGSSETGASTRRMPKVPGLVLAGCTDAADRKGLASAAGAARLIPAASTVTKPSGRRTCRFLPYF